jgi:hypothetical protein
MWRYLDSFCVVTFCHDMTEPQLMVLAACQEGIISVHVQCLLKTLLMMLLHVSLLMTTESYFHCDYPGFDKFSLKPELHRKRLDQKVHAKDVQF